MLNTPFAPWPCFTPEEAEAVSRVLRSNRVNAWTGQEVKNFEAEFAAWTDCRYAVALSNGTAALEIALKVLGIGPGDDVVVTPRTFIASVACAVRAGARPVFADVDRESQNITANTIRAALTPRTRAIICVHLAGMPCEMDAIMALAEEMGIRVIEDCAQAHGARYKGRSVGSIGHIGVWSFCQDKIMSTAGEGGMLTTNRPEWRQQAWSIKDHGRRWETGSDREPSTRFKWIYDSFGTNARMLEIQAAVGRLQLTRMSAWHAARSANAAQLRGAAADLAAIRVPAVPEYCEHAWYKCYLFLQRERIRSDWNRDRILTEILQRGVPCYTGACPEVYLEKAFEGNGLRPSRRLPVAQELGETSMMFLVHPTLSRSEIVKTCEVLSEVMSEAAA
jgi:dTDP-4-amino-4,6-dideoxygalactose transaminase